MGIAKENLNSKEAKRAKAKIQGGGIYRANRVREEEPAEREVGKGEEGRDRKRTEWGERQREPHGESGMLPWKKLAVPPGLRKGGTRRPATYTDPRHLKLSC